MHGAQAYTVTIAGRDGTPSGTAALAGDPRDAGLSLGLVVVEASSGRNKLGSLLYTDLFAHARARAIPLITCEYNLVPANEPSRRFHDKFGFAEVGTQWVSNGTKLVSLQVARTNS